MCIYLSERDWRFLRLAIAASNKNRMPLGSQPPKNGNGMEWLNLPKVMERPTKTWYVSSFIAFNMGEFTLGNDGMTSASVVSVLQLLIKSCKFHVFCATGCCKMRMPPTKCSRLMNCLWTKVGKPRVYPPLTHSQLKPVISEVIGDCANRIPHHPWSSGLFIIFTFDFLEPR